MLVHRQRRDGIFSNFQKDLRLLTVEDYLGPYNKRSCLFVRSVKSRKVLRDIPFASIKNCDTSEELIKLIRRSVK